MTATSTLQVSTPSEHEIALTRVFDAPRRLVFRALTEPELVKRWMGPIGWTLSECTIDLRVGGRWRYVLRGADGMEMGLSGVYQEIVAPARIVSTEAYDQPWYEGDALDTQTLDELDGRTTLTTTVRYASEEIRDAVLRSGMDQGMAQGYDRLAEVLAALV